MSDQEHSPGVRQMIVMWCSEGLECVLDYTDEERQRALAQLKGEPYRSTMPNLRTLEIRARANSQRHYEIYALLSRVPADDIRELFEQDPQAAADLIRKLGEPVFSDRAQDHRVVIR